MWLRSSLAALLMVVVHFGASEQHVLHRRQSSPPLPEKYSVYVKPLPSNKNHHSLSFVGEPNQPPKLSLKKLDQQKGLTESSLPKYQLPLVPHFQRKKLEQSSNVQLSSLSFSKASIQLEHQEPNSQSQHQFSTQILKSQLPLTPQVQSHQNQSKYQIHHTLSPQSYSKIQAPLSPKSQHQVLTQSQQNHYQLPIPAQTLSSHTQFRSEQSQIPQTSHSLQRKYLKVESLLSSGSDKADDTQHKKTSQVIFVNGQPVVINPTESQKAPSSPVTQNSHDSHAFLSSPTTDAIFQEKLLGSVQSQVQSVIQKAPASEIEYDKGGPASDRDNNDDAYVVYYYYYYDDDDEPNNKTSPSLKFDDIPNLENFDESKTETTNVKKDVRRVGQRGNVPNNVISNAFSDTSLSKDRSGQPGTLSLNNSAQSKNADVSSKPVKDPVLPIAPISNVYRYGNDVSRFPVTPDLVDHSTKNQKPTIVTDVSVEDKEDNLSVNSNIQDHSTTTFSEDDPSSKSDLFSSVNDSNSGAEINEIVEAQTEPLTRKDPTIEIEVTKTTESTTTQEPITTTVSVPSRFSNRRRFGSRRPPGYVRSRRPPVIDLTTTKVVKTEAPEEDTEKEESTTVSTTTITSTTSRRSRLRSRLGNRRRNVGFNRQRPSFRRSRFRGSNNDSDKKKDEENGKIEEKSTEKETTTTSTTAVTESSRPTARRRFGSLRSSRRFGSSRRKSSSITVSPESTSNDESTTVKTTTAVSRVRSSSIFGRSNTRSRLSFLRRGRSGLRRGSKVEKEPEEDDVEAVDEEKKSSTPKIADKTTVTSLSEEVETTTTTDTLLSSNEDEYDVEEDEEPQISEDPITTTTENSRFSGLFRKRKRPTLFGNRPRLL
ncbi:uncharacterized protein LOC111088092 [Limulus polyphemus]|uniref:Uncharacterized protein LOC111088092 n=1 Tax=Limulus polyphemus TaxID=6850 RepID=A0ABM1TA35_LIMPO|nr:uncharacterized protein LOC111088092 [Limulus polyphemus]